MSYVTNDVGALQGALIENVIEMVTEGVILIGSIIAMLYLHWKLTLFTFGTAPIVLKLVDIFGRKIRRTGHNMQESTADITSVLQETVASARVSDTHWRGNGTPGQRRRQCYARKRLQDVHLFASSLTALFS